MVKTLRPTLLLAVVMLTTSSVFAQFASWPFPNTVKPMCNTMPSAPAPVTVPPANTCTKWPVVNNGFWNEPSTWNGNSLPAQNDIVCIPANVTVRVRNNNYEPLATSCPATSANTPNLFIFVCGTIDFDPSGRLNIGCNSNFQIYTGGRILAAQGASELIRIGEKIVWGGTDASLTGPWFINAGCGSNPRGCQGAGALPVELGTFTVQQRGPQQVELQWTTLTELNATSFVAERSLDGANWKALGTVAAKGQSQAVVNYHYSDAQAPAGTVLYRLRQVDLDGRFIFSDIVRISIVQTTSIQLYPNPVAASATLFAPNGFNHAQSIQIFGANGNLVETIPGRSGNSITIAASKLKPGIYTIRVIENGQSISQIRMLKQ